MDDDGSHRRSPDLLQTTFLIPNLHCPTCVTYIQSLVDTFRPRPADINVSIVEHSVTVYHEPALRVSTISDALNSSGYEVFDTIIDPTSKDLDSFSEKHGSGMQAAIQRWKPWSSAVDEIARRKHDEHCQMCNAGLKVGGMDDITIGDSIVEQPAYTAIISIEGMTCSSCVGTVTNAVKEIPSVVQADVSLVNHSGHIQFLAEDVFSEVKKLAEAIEDVGYGAELVEIKPRIAERRPDPSETDDLWEVAYAIEGMTCSSCVGNITNALNKLKCVQSVNVDLIQHSGTIKFSGRGNEDTIRDTIEDTGYDIMQTEIKSLVQQRAVSSTRTASITIDGMHCPECPKRVLSALKELPLRVEKSPSLNDPVIKITYNPDAPIFTIRSIMDTIQAVDKSFNVSFYRSKSLEERSRRMLARERKALLARVVLAIIIAIPTLIIGVVYMNLVPHTDAGQRYLMEPLHGVSRAEWATFIMATPVYFFATDHFHRRTIKEVYAMWRPRSTVPIAKRFYRFGSMNMLISLGTTIAYFSSLAELIVTASSPSKETSKDTQQAYFDSVVFLTMFLLMGRYAEAHMKAKSGNAVAALGNLRPTEALLISSKESDVQKVSVDLIDTGDVIRVLPGSSPPCDGKLLEELAEFDESSLTGESRMIRKSKGDDIFAGTINKGSALSMRVTAPAGASMLDSIIQVVREGQAKRAPVEGVADLLTSYFVPAIVLIAISTWIIWLALGLSDALPRSYLDSHFGGWSFWSLQFAIAVFVIACPCGLGLAAPTALFVGGGMAAKRGILVKGGG